MKIGDLFIFDKRMSIHDDVDGCVGIVLAERNKHGQYRVRVAHKELYILSMNMRKI